MFQFYLLSLITSLGVCSISTISLYAVDCEQAVKDLNAKLQRLISSKENNTIHFKGNIEADVKNVKGKNGINSTSSQFEIWVTGDKYYLNSADMTVYIDNTVTIMIMPAYKEIVIKKSIKGGRTSRLLESLQLPSDSLLKFSRILDCDESAASMHQVTLNLSLDKTSSTIVKSMKYTIDTKNNRLVSNEITYNEKHPISRMLYSFSDFFGTVNDDIWGSESVKRLSFPNTHNLTLHFKGYQIKDYRQK